MITEKEAVLRERAAAELAITSWVSPAVRDREADREDWINRTFPLPKVTRPRVVVDPETDSRHFSVRGGMLHHQWDGGTWETIAWRGIMPTLARVRLWVDLLERPNEDVEE